MSAPSQPSLQKSQRYYERSAELWANSKGFRKLANVNVSLIEALQRDKGQTTSSAMVEMAVSVVLCASADMRTRLRFD